MARKKKARMMSGRVDANLAEAVAGVAQTENRGGTHEKVAPESLLRHRFLSSHLYSLAGGKVDRLGGFRKVENQFGLL